MFFSLKFHKVLKKKNTINRNLSFLLSPFRCWTLPPIFVVLMEIKRKPDVKWSFTLVLFWKTLESVSGLVTGKWRLHDHCALVPFISDVRATLREKRVYRAHDNNTKYTLSHFLLTDLCSCSTARHYSFNAFRVKYIPGCLMRLGPKTEQRLVIIVICVLMIL